MNIIHISIDSSKVLPVSNVSNLANSSLFSFNFISNGSHFLPLTSLVSSDHSPSSKDLLAAKIALSTSSLVPSATVKIVS